MRDEGEWTLVAEEITRQEGDVGGTLGETAHEVGEPVLAVRNVDANAVAILDEPALEVSAHSVQHLKFEIVLGNLLGGSMPDGGRDHARVVRGDPVVEAAG